MNQKLTNVALTDAEIEMVGQSRAKPKVAKYSRYFAIQVLVEIVLFLILVANPINILVLTVIGFLFAIAALYFPLKERRCSRQAGNIFLKNVREGN